MLVHPDPLPHAITTAVSEHISHTDLDFPLGVGGALLTPKSSALRPRVLEAQAQAHPHCQAPTWGGVRAEPAAQHLRLLLSSHQLRIPTVDDWFGFHYEGLMSAYT